MQGFFMNFRTKIDIKTSEKKINHEQNLLLIGSCFTIEIGEILEKKGFKGEEIGKALNNLLDAVIENKVKNTKTDLLTYIL